MARTIDFWNAKLAKARVQLKATVKRYNELDQRRTTRTAACLRLRRGTTRRMLRLKLRRDEQKLAKMTREMNKLQARIAFYETRIEARKTRTVWTVLKRPEV